MAKTETVGSKNMDLGEVMQISLERIKKVAQDIKDDESWVNDSHSSAEHKGIVDGLDMLIEHLEEDTEYGEDYEEDDDD